MSKSLKWPLAKIRKEDKCPAIWLSYHVWKAIRRGLITVYIDARRYHGQSEARVLANKRDEILDVFRMDLNDASEAMTIYRLGFAHNVPDPTKHPDLYTTPADLVKLGDKSERKAFERQLDDLREGPSLPK